MRQFLGFDTQVARVSDEELDHDGGEKLRILNVERLSRQLYRVLSLNLDVDVDSGGENLAEEVKTRDINGWMEITIGPVGAPGQRMAGLVARVFNPIWVHGTQTPSISSQFGRVR